MPVKIFGTGRLEYPLMKTLSVVLVLSGSFNAVVLAQQTAVPPVSTIPSVVQPIPVAPNANPAIRPDINTKELLTKGDKQKATNLPPVKPQGRPVLGLALEGGGALGLAHIGVLEWLDEHHIPIDRIAGTSMGCFVAALQASGNTPAQMSNIALGTDFQNVFALQAPYNELSYRRKEDRTHMPQAITLGLKHGIAFRNALLTDKGLNGVLLESFSTYSSEELDFDRLPTPLRCVATDLNTLKPVIFHAGSVSQAVRASISIPGVFEPINYHGHYLVDGAIVDNLPSDVTRSELKADIVIAVHLQSGAFDKSDIGSLVSVFSRAYAAGVAQTEQNGMNAADEVIQIDTSAFSTSDYGKGKDLIAAGYKAAQEHHVVLEKYALDDASWTLYQADRALRATPPPGLLRTIRVDGGTPSVQAAVRHDLQPLQGQVISAPTLVQQLRKFESDGAYRAAYETFNPSQIDDPSRQKSDTGVHVLLLADPNGPPYLLVGPNLVAMSGNVTQTTLDMRLIEQNFGGFGSELRTDVQLGYLTHLSGEYYRLLSSSGWFIQPRLSLLRRPVYIWKDQERVAEQFEQSAGGGVSVGRTFTPRFQVSSEWSADVVRWSLQSGQPTTPNVSGTAQTARLRATYDSFESGTVSPRGLRLDASMGALYQSPQSPLSPVFHFEFLKSTVWRTKNIIGFGGGVDTYFHHHVADPFRFTLGGPLRLSASSVDEYRGTDTYLLKAGYLRRILPLPSGIGQGIYAMFAYEAGEVWTPGKSTLLRQNVLGGVTAATPLGSITLGVALGDDGHRKTFVTLGRIF